MQLPKCLSLPGTIFQFASICRAIQRSSNVEEMSLLEATERGGQEVDMLGEALLDCLERPFQVQGVLRP